MENPITYLTVRWAIIASAAALVFLATLHFVSPEFDPSWRMVSEYALGNHKWLISLFFVFWGIGSMSLAFSLWSLATGKLGKLGVVLLFISGIGEVLAAVFDAKHGLHGLAAMLGVPTLPIAALLVSYHLKSKEGWAAHKKPLLLSAHATWFSLVLMVVAMMVMMTGFQAAGIEFKEGAEPPKFVPEGVIALGGYTNRILVIAYLAWLIIVARIFLKINAQK
ncbi:MAG: DUF998 domain-containing protein [Saprospiraceae bacterium]